MAEREFTCSPSPNSSSKFFLLFSVSDLHTSRLRTTKRAGEQHPAHDEGAVWTFGLAAPSPVTSSSAPSPRCRPPLLLGSDLGPVQNHIPRRRLMEDGEASSRRRLREERHERRRQPCVGASRSEEQGRRRRRSGGEQLGGEREEAAEVLREKAARDLRAREEEASEGKGR